MPGDARLPIRPEPATGASSRPSKSARWGKSLLFLIAATIALTAFFNNWNSRPTGEVTVLVRGLDGERSVATMQLPGARVNVRDDVDPSSITSISSRTFILTDGSTIGLNAAGVVRTGGGNTSVLIASPIAPFLNTPLAVWGDGARVAWSNPADGTIQIFTRTERGTYVPKYLGQDLRPNSLGFTADGTLLIVTKLGEEDTDVYAIEVYTGEINGVATLPGYITVIPTP